MSWFKSFKRPPKTQLLKTAQPNTNALAVQKMGSPITQPKTSTAQPNMTKINKSKPVPNTQIKQTRLKRKWNQAAAAIRARTTPAVRRAILNGLKTGMIAGSRAAALGMPLPGAAGFAAITAGKTAIQTFKKNPGGGVSLSQMSSMLAQQRRLRNPNYKPTTTSYVRNPVLNAQVNAALKIRASRLAQPTALGPAAGRLVAAQLTQKTANISQSPPQQV